jgi:hypothetical protein
VPLPYDVDSAHSQTIADSFGNSGNKSDHVQAEGSQSTGETNGIFKFSGVFETLRNMDCKSKAGQDQEYLTSAGDEFYEVKRTASSGPIDEEDVCPICPEGTILSICGELYTFFWCWRCLENHNSSVRDKAGSSSNPFIYLLMLVGTWNNYKKVMISVIEK